MPIKHFQNNQNAYKYSVTKRTDKPQPENRGIWRRIFNKRMLKILASLFLLGILALAAMVIWFSRDLPNPNQLINREVAQSTKIYDRTGEHLLYEIHGAQKRTLVSINEIPDNVKHATIAIEDKNFYKHGGISLWAMFRTIVTNVIYRRSAGGSTLTQQLVKNAILTSEKSLPRKIKEMVLAQRIEKKFNKDQILQMYLNEIPYGSSAYGVEEASQKYFGKKVGEVDLAEAAILAALPQAPSRYSPYGSHKDLLLGRKDYVLDLMVEQGYVTKEQGDQAKKEEIKFQKPEASITAPHFVMYIKDILSEKYGEKVMEQGGLKVITTLDYDKQKAAEEILVEKTKNYPEKYNAHNAALVSIDPKNGQVLAMVGSRDYFDDSIDGQVNVATSPRQPGSSMKPLVYATLFEKGYTPNTILYDVNTNFSTDPANPYEPRDYNLKENGPVSIRQALAGSLNIPAVKAIYLADIKNVINNANDLGYTTLTDPDRYGLALVLGGGEVKLLEHTNAFSVFATEGRVPEITTILKIEDKDGKTLEENQSKVKDSLLSKKTTQMINSILSDNQARAYIFTANNFLSLGERPVAAKTGTTNDFRDAWTIGYTPSLVTGVWVGNNDNTKMKPGSDGSVLAAPIWHDFMKEALKNSSVENFTPFDDTKTGKAIIDGDLAGANVIRVDKFSGLLASSSTPPELIEERAVGAPHSILYYVDKDNPLGPKPENPEKDPQFIGWEKGVQDWFKKNNKATSTLEVIPTEYDNVHTEANKPILSISYPANGQSVAKPQMNATISASALRGVSAIEYSLDGGSFISTNGNQNAIINLSGLISGYHKVSFKVCDDVLNCTISSNDFNLTD
ncbi:MAG: PBP1A family penicillin-binding protein [Candidatus Falkowbacteria bacterium]|nr:PBP1A family penicillin-binding protein [Candidatus Falkowbacteria bacterium]